VTLTTAQLLSVNSIVQLTGNCLIPSALDCVELFPLASLTQSQLTPLSLNGG